MSIIQGNALGGGPNTGDIQKSLRFSTARSTYLNRTPSTTTNQTKWTWSGWVKRGTADTNQGLFDAYTNSNNFTMVLFDTSNRLWFYNVVGGVDSDCVSTPVYRDPSSWMHVIFVYDTANATSADRFIFYVNGSRVSVTNPYGVPGLNEPCYINANSALHCVGRITDNNRLLDGYLSRVCLVDGQALTPASFGYTSIDTGEWVTRPQSDIKAVVDAGGANSFMLDFDNGTSLTTLGYDKSSKGNNWTLNNFSLTSGANYDWMDDVPGNKYATFNGIDVANALATLKNANLTLFNATNYTYTRRTEFPVSSGKWYVEFTAVATNGYYPRMGIVSSAESVTSLYGPGMSATSYGIDSYAGDKSNNSVFTAYGSAIVTGDVVGVALDMSAGKIWFSKNGTWFASGDPVAGTGQAFSGITGTMCFAASAYTGEVAFNAGQRPFAYPPPTGFKSLCSQNLPDPVILNPKNHFDIKLHTGTGVAQNITGIPFKPDLVWTKARSIAYTAVIYDAVRGATKFLIPSLTDAEYTNATALTGFNSDGFSVGTDNSNGVNALGISYVDWLWKAGDAPVANTAGSITSQVSANPLAGFSIVTYTGTGANATVGHGLGRVPDIIIFKRRNGATDWHMYHKSVPTPANQLMYLNTTSGPGATIAFLNNTAPSSSVITLGDSVGTNGSSMVAYCFAEIPGYSKIGSYTGNGSADGPFVYCGFRPKFVMIKRTDAAANWVVYDTSRDLVNPMKADIYPNTSNAEAIGGPALDTVANGFKVIATGPTHNASGGTYIFYAVAEQSFKYANAR